MPEDKFGDNINFNRLNLGKVIPLEWPLLLFVELSGFCNFKCKFCPHGTENDRLVQNNMEFELLKHMVDGLCDDKAEIAKVRYCGMGEMLINPKAVEMMLFLRERANKKEFKVDCIELVTNGSRLGDIDKRQLCESVDRIVISIEGLSDYEYKSITETTICFADLLDEIKELYEHKGKCEIVAKIQGGAVQTKEEKKKFEELFYDKADLLAVENLTDMWPGYDTKMVDDQRRFRYQLNGSKVERKQVCVQLFKSLQVYANGDVVPCCFDWERLNFLGNVRSETIREIWKGERLRKLALKHLMLKKGTFAPCDTCYGNDYCDVDDIDSFREEILARMNL